MKNHRPSSPPTHAHLALDGIVFKLDLHKPNAKVALPATVTIGDQEGTLSTAADRPAEFGRPGKHGVRSGVRIHLDRADAADLRVAQTFIEECLSLIEENGHELPIKDSRSK